MLLRMVHVTKDLGLHSLQPSCALVAARTLTRPQHRKRVNSRQLMARLPWPARQVGAVQLLGCRRIYFHDSGHEHKRPLLRPAYWKGCAAMNLHKQCKQNPCRPGSGGQRLTERIGSM